MRLEIEQKPNERKSGMYMYFKFIKVYKIILIKASKMVLRPQLIEWLVLVSL